MHGEVKSNYMINFVIGTVKDSAGKELFHECPYQGRIAVTNLTLKNDRLFSICPSGKYQISVNISEDGVKLISVNVRLDLAT